MKLTDDMCNNFFFAFPLEVKQWIIAIELEMRSAEEEHPNWPEDKIHAAAIVVEEAGELVQSALQFTYEKGKYYRMHNEAIQVGATALRFLLNAPDLPIKD